MMIIGTETCWIGEANKLCVRYVAARGYRDVLGGSWQSECGICRAEIRETFAQGVRRCKRRSRLVNKLIGQVPINAAKIGGASYSSAIDYASVRDHLKWTLPTRSAACVEGDKLGGYRRVDCERSRAYSGGASLWARYACGQRGRPGTQPFYGHGVCCGERADRANECRWTGDSQRNWDSVICRVNRGRRRRRLAHRNARNIREGHCGGAHGDVLCGNVPCAARIAYRPYLVGL